MRAGGGVVTSNSYYSRPLHLQASAHPRLGEYDASTMLIAETVGEVPASQALSDYENVCLHASMTRPFP